MNVLTANPEPCEEVAECSNVKNRLKAQITASLKSCLLSNSH